MGMADTFDLDELMCKWTSDIDDEDNLRKKKKPSVVKVGDKTKRSRPHVRPQTTPQKTADVASPTTKFAPTIRDLCDSDKARIAELIKELGRVTSQKEEIVHKMKSEKDFFETQLSHLNSEKKGLMEERLSLQEQLTRTQHLLASLQQQLSEQLQVAAFSHRPLNASPCLHRCRESGDKNANESSTRCRRHFTEHIDAELRRAQAAEPTCCSSPVPPPLPACSHNNNNTFSHDVCEAKSRPAKACRSDCSAESTPACSTVLPRSDTGSAMEQRIADVDARNTQSRRELLIREREVLERERRCLALILAQQELIAAQQDAARDTRSDDGKQEKQQQQEEEEAPATNHRRGQSASAPVTQRSRIVRPKSQHSVHSVVIRPGLLNRCESRASSRTPSSLCESVNIQLPETEEETTASPNHFVRHDRYMRRPGRSPPSPPSSILDIVESMNGAEDEESDRDDDENRLLEDVFFVRLL